MADSNKKPVDDQNHQPDNAGLQHKLTEKQTSADIDQGSLRGKTSHSDDGESQRADINTTGAADRPSIGEISTDKHREKNRILNEQVKDPENKPGKNKQ